MKQIISATRRINILFLLKTGIGSAIAIFVASGLNLMYSPSAGIITLLTIQNTKKETLEIALKRILAFVIAVIISALSFNTIGYTPFAFGVFVLLFVGACTIFKLKDGISMNAVLMTHFLIEKNTSMNLILNEILLLFIGMGIGISLNLIMPKYREKIRTEQKEVEEFMKQVIRSLASLLRNKDACLIQSNDMVEMDHSLSFMRQSTVNQRKFNLDNQTQLEMSQGKRWKEEVQDELDSLDQLLESSLYRAYEDAGNTLLNNTRYLVSYFEMRKQQLQVLRNIKEQIDQIPVVLQQSYPIAEFMEHTADSFHELNNAVGLLEQIKELKRFYREQDLPSSRDEFEHRAILYQILKQMEYFLKLKRNFIKELDSNEVKNYWS